MLQHASAEVMRIFRFVIALRTLVRSIGHTLKALIWALLLLSLIVYAPSPAPASLGALAALRYLPCSSPKP